MKKLFAIAFAAVVIVALPSFSNSNTSNKIKPTPSVKMISLNPSEVGANMDKLAGKGKNFIPSACITTDDLKSILSEAKASGSEIVRLSVVRNSSGNNCLIANYYKGSVAVNLNKNNETVAPNFTADSEYHFSLDAVYNALDSTPTCCPRCTGKACKADIFAIDLGNLISAGPNHN